MVRRRRLAVQCGRVTPIGRIRELARYPVKSMAGTPVDSVQLGLHGIAGDRRLAFRRKDDASSFPWLSASRLPQLIRYQPVAVAETWNEPRYTHVRTPAGALIELRGDELQREISALLGSPVELMELKHGIFDDASVSVITSATIDGIGKQAGFSIDRRRMRANVILETDVPQPFHEDEWIGGTLVFGDGPDAAAVTITARDLRCVMVNLDPDTAENDPRIMKAVVRLNRNYAGVYGTVVRAGPIHVGQTVSLVR